MNGEGINGRTVRTMNGVYPELVEGRMTFNVRLIENSRAEKRILITEEIWNEAKMSICFIFDKSFCSYCRTLMSCCLMHIFFEYLM